MENLLNCHGREFSADINYKPCMGHISIEGKNIYLKELERINESHKFHTRRK